MAKLILPSAVRRVSIYADNDADTEYAGQARAFELARRLKKDQRKSGSRHVEVFVPRHAGTDWADVWRSRIADVKQAA